MENSDQQYTHQTILKQQYTPKLWKTILKQQYTPKTLKIILKLGKLRSTVHSQNSVKQYQYIFFKIKIS